MTRAANRWRSGGDTKTATTPEVLGSSSRVAYGASREDGPALFAPAAVLPEGRDWDFRKWVGHGSGELPLVSLGLKHGFRGGFGSVFGPSSCGRSADELWSDLLGFELELGAFGRSRRATRLVGLCSNRKKRRLRRRSLLRSKLQFCSDAFTIQRRENGASGVL